MKKINTYSAQYKIISEQPIQNQNNSKIKKKITKDGQEFINNISAS